MCGIGVSRDCRDDPGAWQDQPGALEPFLVGLWNLAGVDRGRLEAARRIAETDERHARAGAADRLLRPARAVGESVVVVVLLTKKIRL